MNNYKITAVPSAMPGVMSSLMLMCCLFFSWSAEATAPRIAPTLFGDERKTEVVSYQSGTLEAAARSENALTVELVTEAFAAAGKTLAVDVLPSRQLAKYALVNGDAAALIGGQKDLTVQEANQYRVVTFYVQGNAANEEAVSLIVSKKHTRGNELHQAFSEGLLKIVKSGKYLAIVEKHLGKEHVPAGYFNRLKRYNPSLK